MNEVTLGCPNEYLTTDTVTGIQYSFNYGVEIKTPTDIDEVWTIRLYNESSGDILIEVKLPPGGYYSTPVKYYVKWKIEATCKSRVFTHVYDCRGRYVLFKMTHTAIGDCIAYLSQVQAFVELHKCKPIIYAQKWFIDLFKPAYPDYTFCEGEDEFSGMPIYATYFLGIIFDPRYIHAFAKYPYQQFGLQHVAGNILGMPYNVEPQAPHVVVTREVELKRPYVAISYSGSKACKVWQNPMGWEAVIKHLNERGFDVMCIDRDSVIGMPGSFVRKPNGVIDMVGQFPLQERVNQISGASFFIGMASGLAWLAWCCRKPVVMISGFSRPSMEFYTPYRVYNEENLCNDCWGDSSIQFYHHDWNWCPRVDAKLHDLDERIKNTPTIEERLLLFRERDEILSQKFSCTMTITPARVIKTIDQLIEDNKLCEN